MPKKKGGGRAGQKKSLSERQNVPPGTVVEGTITLPAGDDWYFVPHHGLQGTSRPSHFHLLRNDGPHAPTTDELKRFTYDLCFLFARATPPGVRAGRRRSASSTPWVSRRRDAAKQNARVVRETVVSATAGVRDSHRASASRGGEAETSEAQKSG